jgi:hypothetical protein
MIALHVSVEAVSIAIELESIQPAYKALILHVLLPKHLQIPQLRKRINNDTENNIQKDDDNNDEKAQIVQDSSIVLNRP